MSARHANFQRNRLSVAHFPPNIILVSIKMISFFHFWGKCYLLRWLREHSLFFFVSIDSNLIYKWQWSQWRSIRMRFCRIDLDQLNAMRISWIVTFFGFESKLNYSWQLFECEWICDFIFAFYSLIVAPSLSHTALRFLRIIARFVQVFVYRIGLTVMFFVYVSQ